MINLDDPELRYLIDYANLKQGLIKYQKNFLSPSELIYFFRHEYYGIPLVLPLGIKYFVYNKKNTFKIDKNLILRNIFNTNKRNYIGLKIFFKFGNKFSHDVKLKKKYLSHFSFIINENKKLINNISLKKKHFFVCSFQTRNIPHLGHETIIKKMIKKKSIVFINPLIGLKKKGDYRNDILKRVFKKLENYKSYKKKVFYGPVLANMHYGGPREAMHHINLREKLGFNQFTIGRDHAGAQNVYPPLAAHKVVKKNKKFFKINILSHKGSYFCLKCNKAIILGECKHNSLVEISGSEFRNSIIKKKQFKYARYDLQSYIKNIRGKIFY